MGAPAIEPIAAVDLLDRWPELSARPLPFLLDSGDTGRWCVAGSDPAVVLLAKGPRVSLWRNGRETRLHADPFETLRSLLAERPMDPVPGLPFPGGAVGAFGYDLGGRLERLPRRAEDDLDFPDLVVGFYDRLELFDRLEGRGFSFALPGSDGPRAMEAWPEECGPGPARAGDTFTRETYLDAVRRVKDYLEAGDLYQANLSQRFHARTDLEPGDVFRALRAASPAPYGALLQFGERGLISASPELFLELRGSRAMTRPIKGTRRRGAGPEEDAKLRGDLLSSPKDDAELAMIVDLERNDLGRVCRPGSVRVEAPKTLETHPTVHHLSATVVGELREGLGPIDLLKASFPGGSITGAPKIRAMEIIDELEPTRRAFYTGSIGWIGYDGSMTLSVAIRTIHRQGRDHWFQAGGGIVVDSDPGAEYEETLAKARAMARVLGRERLP